MREQPEQKRRIFSQQFINEEVQQLNQYREIFREVMKQYIKQRVTINITRHTREKG